MRRYLRGSVSDVTPGFGGTAVLVRDLRRGTVELASPSIQGGASYSLTGSISADGRYVVFETEAPNIVPGDTNFSVDVFVYDRETDTVERVSVDSFGAEAWWDSYGAAISGDGRVVAFRSMASNLVPNDTNGAEDVFAHDMTSGATWRVSVTSGGMEGHSLCVQIPCHFWWPIDISYDGRVIAFSSWMHDLVPNDTNGEFDVFVRDENLGTTTLASVSSSGVQGNWLSTQVSLSGDGNLVAFTSGSTNLINGDANNDYDVFLHDRTTGVTSLVNVDPSGQQTPRGAGYPSMSRNGRYVSFGSWDSTLVPNDTNNGFDIFVRDVTLGTTRRATLGIGGQQVTGLNAPEEWAVGEDGAVVFSIQRDGWVVGDNAIGGVNDWETLISLPSLPSSSLLGYCTAKTNSVNCMPRISVCGAPLLSGDLLFSIIAVKARSHEPGMPLWSLQPFALPFGGGTLCVAAPRSRTPIQDSGGLSTAIDCTGTYSFPMSSSYMTNHGLVAGTTVYAQYFSRDSGFAPPNDVGLTDGLQFVVLP
jgi:hypothetical protein